MTVYFYTVTTVTSTVTTFVSGNWHEFQSELPLTIGLGDRTSVEKVRIRWPDGPVQELDHVVLDSTTTVIQPR